MDKDTAEDIIESLAWMALPIGEIDRAISDDSQADKSQLIKLLGDIMSAHFALTMHIINRFPELDPDDMGKENYQKLKEK